MIKCTKELFLIIFIFILYCAYADTSETTFTLIIPGEVYQFIPSWGTTTFADSGNQTVNLTVYLKNINTGEQNLSNGANVTGVLTSPNSSEYNVSFNNTLSNGLYQLLYDFNQNGTWVLNATITNSSVGTTYSQTNINIGIFSFNLTLTTDKQIYAKSESASATLTVTDQSGTPQTSGTAMIRITDTSAGIWLDWINMTNLFGGIFYLPFGAPNTVGTYTVTANYSSGANSNQTYTYITITLPTYGNTGPGGPSRYEEAGGGEMRYDIIPRRISAIVRIGEQVYKSFIIKNLAGDSLVVEVDADMPLTYPNQTKFGIAPNSEQEIEFKLGGNAMGIYNKEVFLKLYNFAGRTAKENLSVSYEIIGKKAIGEYCLINEDCLSGYCKNNLCEAKQIIIPTKELKSWTKEHHEFFLISALILLVALVIIVVFNIGERKERDYLTFFGRNIDKKIILSLLFVVVLFSIAVPAILFKRSVDIENELPTKIESAWEPKELKYEISPRGISTLFLAGETPTHKLRLSNFEKGWLIFTFKTDLVIPNKMVVQSDKTQEIDLFLSGSIGEYERIIDIEVTDAQGNIEKDKIKVNYEIIEGKNIGSNCLVDSECYSKNCFETVCAVQIKPIKLQQIDNMRPWAQEHPAFFFFMAAVLIIGGVLIWWIWTRDGGLFEKRLSTALICALIILSGAAIYGITNIPQPPVLNDTNISISYETPLKPSSELKEWSTENTRYFVIAGIILILGLAAVVLVNKKSKKETKNTNKFNLLIMVAVIISILVPVLLFVQKEQSESKEIPTYAPSNWTYLGMKYDVSPKSQYKTIILGEVQQANFVITNFEQDYLIFSFDSDLMITPKKIAVIGRQQQKVEITLTGPKGNYEREIKFNVENKAGEIVKDSLYLYYSVIEGKALSESCTINEECYSNYCLDKICVPAANLPKQMIELKPWAQEHPEFFFIMAAVLIIAGTLIWWISTRKKPEFEKRLSIVLILIAVGLIGVALVSLLSLSDPTSEFINIPEYKDTTKLKGDVINYEIVPGKILSNISLGSNHTEQIRITNLDRNKIYVYFDTDMVIKPRNLIIEPTEISLANLSIEKGIEGVYQKEIITKVTMLGLSEVNSIVVEFNVLQGTPRVSQRSFMQLLKDNLMAVVLFIFIILILLLAIIISQVKKNDPKINK